MQVLKTICCYACGKILFSCMTIMEEQDFRIQKERDPMHYYVTGTTADEQAHWLDDNGLPCEECILMVSKEEIGRSNDE